MGFDLYIHMCMIMDETTGKPFYYGLNEETGKSEKIFGLPIIEIPEELRKYMYLRGHHMHVYTDKFNRKDIYHVSSDTFLERFPSWTRYRDSDYYADDPSAWTHDDHRNLKKLLKFLELQMVDFSVSWNY